MAGMDWKLSRRTRCAASGILALSLLGLSGCGASRSQVSASNEIATAMFAIRDAKASGAETYAMPELQRAEALVEQARKLDGEEAERLAEEALAHAQLAAVTASRESARHKLVEAQKMNREAGALKERTTEAVEERLR